MKKTFFLVAVFTILAALLFSSCKKDNPDTSTTSTVRYEFTSDKDGNYIVRYKVDSTETDETIAGSTWSKTIVVNKGSISNTSLTAFAPADWFGTANEANATVKIFINGEEKASNSGVLVGLDRPTGLTVSTGVE